MFRPTLVLIFTILWQNHPSSDISSASLGHPHRFSYLGQFDNGYPEDQYEKVLQNFEAIYGPYIESLGGRLVILKDWSDGAVNMWAERWGNDYRLEIPGGMARYHLINEEGFVLSICHELGHLLGGPPQRGQISLEGQADHYTGKSCIEKMLAAIAPYKSEVKGSEIVNLCKNQGRQNRKICERAVAGALSLTSYYAELEKSPPPRISTPSSSRPNKTLLTHPPAQCRLDTFLAGYLQKPRPRCWYVD